MENLISIPLVHFSVDVVAGIVSFNNLLGEQFDSECRITENNGLINV